MQTTLDWAKRYIDAGFKVFPIAARSKFPLKGSHGFKDATDDHQQAEAWWGNTDHGIGVATGAISNCVVFDVDEPCGLEVLQSWGISELPELAATSSNKKEDGKISLALWFRLPVGWSFKSTVRSWPGIDVRGCGGYMIVPPSIHPSNSQYSWLSGDLKLPELPQRFSQELLLTKSKVVTHKSVTHLEIPEHFDRIPLEEAKKLIHSDATKAATQWAKAAQKKLKDTGVFSALFENGYIPDKGSRFNSLRVMIGIVVGQLYNMPGTSPQLILGLFHDVIEKIQDNENKTGGRDDFETKAWDMICAFYAADKAQARVMEIEKAKTEAQSRSLVEKIVEGVSSWIDPVTKTELDKFPEAWIRRHGILSCGARQYYMMTNNGHYGKWPLADKQLIPEIIHKGFEQIFPPQTKTEKGELRWLSTNEIVNSYAVNIQNVTYAAVSPEQSLGATVDFKAQSLTIPAFWRRTDIEAEYDPDCDKFLRVMFGRKYGEVEGWFAHALAVEERKPICGLVIVGPKGIGKSLLGLALIHCFTNGSKVGNVVDANEAFHSAFNAGFKDTPVIYMDEGVENTGIKKRDISIQFRQMIGTEYHSVNQKNRDLVQIRSNLRFLVTANETSALDNLVGTSLDSHSFEAISQRIKYINIDETDGEAIKKFLTDRGQWTLTDSWLREEAKLVKHLFWIYKERRASHPEAGRFLVDGGLDDETMHTLKMRSSINGQLLRAIVDEIIKKPLPGTASNTFSMVVSGNADTGLVIENGEVYLMRETAIRLLSRVPEIDKYIDPALEVLTIKPKNPIHINKLKKRWRKLRKNLFLEYIEDSQHCEKIKKLLGVTTEEKDPHGPN